MVALFESFLHPAVIMFSIPFSFIGVAVTLKLTGQTLGNTAMLGLVLLAGIVVNNAIVLIAHVNTLRREGMSRDEALVLGSEHRLRPVMMTALTTFCGLMPLAAPYFLPGLFGSADGRAGQWAPIGLVLAGGLPTSTLLTLLLVPTIYAVTDDLKRLIWPYTTAPEVPVRRASPQSTGAPALNPVSQ